MRNRLDSLDRKKFDSEQGCFALCGERPGTLSLDPASIFEKLLDQKTFLPAFGGKLISHYIDFSGKMRYNKKV